MSEPTRSPDAARDDLSVLDALASDEVGEIIGERLLQRALLRLREAVASRSEVTLSPEEAHHLLRRIGGDDESE